MNSSLLATKTALGFLLLIMTADFSSLASAQTRRLTPRPSRGNALSVGVIKNANHVARTRDYAECTPAGSSRCDEFVTLCENDDGGVGSTPNGGVFCEVDEASSSSRPLSRFAKFKNKTSSH
ncbi:hypothetical protein [Synechococcus sp. Cu2B8-bc1011]|uniref:hypothetical protein n=1 Tax=Synechococcus sp. Cu2B8-bc1011 TaxID=3093725 RepID=UPI0039B082EE